MKSKAFWLTGIICLSLLVYTCAVNKQTFKRDATGRLLVDSIPNRLPLSPQQALGSFFVQPGYHLELVASEPMIEEPVAIAWDANGRLYVAEMNTYMQDVDGTNENEPHSRIKLLEDTNGDGKMDKVTVFIDSLVLPRMILPLDNRILVNETYSNNIYSYEDTNGDGKADVKKLVYANNTIDNKNLEHQKSGLVWNLDNRIYVTMDAVRYQFKNDKLVPDTLIESPWGQWGLTADDYGRLYLSSAGGETPAINFQQNLHYGQYSWPGQIDETFQAVWPIIATPDVQGGSIRLRTDSTLNHFTACTGQSIYRGDRFPADFRGDLIICEPVGRLIRRAKVINNEGRISLVNAYTKEEFIASNDMNFRPVNSATGPDGNLYIVDMYRGIIQEGHWTREGSYLRPQIISKGLDKNIRRGRIYRVVADGIKPAKTRPQLINAPSSQLVDYLSHPNGWWRDNAQKLLVLRNDKAVIPALKQLATAAKQLTRIHALWTLQGMEVLDRQLLFEALKDADAKVRKTAVWIAEDFIQNNDTEVLNKLSNMRDDADPEVRFQLALTLRFNKTQQAKEIINYLVANSDANSILTLSQKKYEKWVDDREQAIKKAKMLADEERKLVEDGAVIFKQLCASCHGADGRGINNGGKDMPAPPLAGSNNVNGNAINVIKILLHGLKGPVNGKTYPDVMPAMGHNDDKYIASVLSYIRTNLGNKAKVVKPEEVKKVRQLMQGRTTPWTVEELETAAKN